jgi:hypothetical protein
VTSQEYRKHFPFGIFTGGGNATIRDVNGSGTSIATNSVTGLKIAVNHPDVGMKATGMPYIARAGIHVQNQESAQGISTMLEGEVRGGNIYQLAGTYQRATTDELSGWDSTSWFGTAYNASFHTDAAADTLAAEYATVYASHPSVLAFDLRDDVSSIGGTAEYREAAIACKAMQRATGKPCVCVWTTKEAYAEMGTDLRLIFSYQYPCGRYSNNTDTAEGDFHRSTFNSLFVGADWVDVLRDFLSLNTANVPVWWIMQAHKHPLVSVSASNLRYPTPREMRKQTWVAIGEGVKGMFWFAYNDTVDWDGLAHPNSADRMSAVSEMADRLTPEIRRAILRCTKTTDLFTTSGGGTSGLPVNYASAYVSTLADPNGDLYVVLCNNSTSDAVVTVNSATKTGYLENMETGARFKIGATVTLPPLDGGFYKYDPYIGVPVWNPFDWAGDVEAYDAAHWANPASPDYWAPSSVKHWPREIVVTPGPGALQAAVDAAPEYTTIRITPGTYDEFVEMSGKSHIHFIADNPLDKPVLRGIYNWGNDPWFRYSNGNIPPTEGAIFSLTNSVAARLAHRNPVHDIIYKDLIFDGGGAVVWERYEAISDVNTVPNTKWRVDHWAIHSPIWMRNASDILVQNCTFRNYPWGNDPYPGDVGVPVYPEPFIEATATGSPGRWHPGMVSGNAGIRSVTVRNCTFTGSATTRGDIIGIFFDGARGIYVHNNTFTGKFQGQQMLFLTNDDYTQDYEKKGRITEDHDARNAKLVVVASNTLTKESYGVSYTGQDLLVRNNTLPLGTGINYTFARVFARCSRRSFDGHIYRHWNLIFRNNAITGTGAVTTWVETHGAEGAECDEGQPDPNPYRGVLGRISVINNTGPSGGVTNWILDVSEPTEGNVISGNTP